VAVKIKTLIVTAMPTNIVEKIFYLIKLRHSLIAIESPQQERSRFIKELCDVATPLNKKIFLWTFETDQLHQVVKDQDQGFYLQKLPWHRSIVNKTKPIDYFEILNFWKNTEQRGILILEGILPWISPNTDPNHMLTSEWIKSALRNFNLFNRDSDNCCILLGTDATLSSDITVEIPTVIQELPDIKEIANFLKKELMYFNFTSAQIYEIANASVGMYLADIEYGLIKHQVDRAPQLAKSLFDYKIDLLKKVYNVDFLPPATVEIGGLELMQKAISVYKRFYTPLAEMYRIKPMKGILLVGPPGTGKSHSAKACSQNLGFPLIIIEWGIFRSYGHMAEQNLKKLLRLIDRLNRVIVYFDDFDKGFAGDDDLSKRLAGMLLTWMQERTSEALVVASANNLDLLPPEITRCGRFDEIFKVDLPNNGERYEIFRIHLARFDQRFRKGSVYSKTEWNEILKLSNRCVGAEIQSIVERAAGIAFNELFPNDETTFAPFVSMPNLEISPANIKEARNAINPLAVREANRIERLRNKADLQGLPSSPEDNSIFSNENVSIFS